jgi:hypothetical protein
MSEEIEEVEEQKDVSVVWVSSGRKRNHKDAQRPGQKRAKYPELCNSQRFKRSLEWCESNLLKPKGGYYSPSKLALPRFQAVVGCC